MDAGLAALLRYHPRLRAALVEEGLPSIALLMLWEVDKNMPFPSTAGGSESSLVLGFTKRLLRRVQLDDVLRDHMVPCNVVGALGPGLRDSHCLRWPVQIVPPAATEPRAWFELFTQRWKEYLASLRLSAVPDGPEGRRIRSAGELTIVKRRRTVPPTRTPATPVATSPAATTTRTTRARSSVAEDEAPPRRSRPPWTVGGNLHPRRFRAMDGLWRAHRPNGGGVGRWAS